MRTAAREVGRDDGPSSDKIHCLASPQFKPICGSTSPLTGAPGKVSVKPSIIDCLRISARASGLIFANFEHDFVVQPRDQAAIYADVEQPIIGVSERQHRGVSAGALNRQIAAAGVERLAFGNAALGVNSPDFPVGVLADYDA